METDKDFELIHLALLAKDQAYHPYSNFRVGSSVLTSSGKTYYGCSVDNVEYSLSTCAERVAITTAISEGETSITTIAIASDLTDQYITPCGGCRQIISEFNSNCRVILVKGTGAHMITSITRLLPSPS